METSGVKIDDLAEELVAQMETMGYRPTRIIALARGGFTVAAALAKKLGILGDNVVGVPVEEHKPGLYRIALWFLPLMRTIAEDEVLILLDDSSISGRLANGVAADCIQYYGAKDARSCVFIASVEGAGADFVGTTCEGKPPKLQ